MNNSFQIKLINNTKERQLKQEFVDVVFVEQEPNESQYIIGRGLGENNKPVAIINIDGNDKQISLYNKDNLLINFVNEDELKENYLTLKVDSVETFPNADVSVKVVNKEGEISNIIIRGTDIVINKGMENQVQIAYDKPLNIELSSNYFKDIADGKIKAKAFPSQMFDAVKNSDFRMNNVECKQFELNGKQINLLTVKNLKNSKNKMFLASSTEMIELGKVIDGSEKYDLSYGDEKVFDHDLAFQFKKGKLSSSGAIGDNAAILRNIAEEDSKELINYVKDQIGESSISQVSKKSYETIIKNVEELNIKDKKKQVVGLMKNNDVQKEEAEKDEQIEKEEKILNTADENLNENQQKTEKDEKEKTDRKMLNADGSFGRKIKYGFLGFGLGGFALLSVFTGLAGMLFPAFVFLGLAMGMGIITSQEVVTDYKKVNLQNLKRKTAENIAEAEKLEEKIAEKSKTNEILKETQEIEEKGQEIQINDDLQEENEKQRKILSPNKYHETNKNTMKIRRERAINNKLISNDREQE